MNIVFPLAAALSLALSGLVAIGIFLFTCVVLHFSIPKELRDMHRCAYITYYKYGLLKFDDEGKLLDVPIYALDVPRERLWCNLYLIYYTEHLLLAKTDDKGFITNIYQRSRSK